VPLEQLHHHVRRAVRQAVDVEDPRHVRPAQRHRGARLAVEARAPLGRQARLGPEDLDRHPLVQPLVVRLQDHPDAALPDHADDRVLAGEDVAGPREAVAALDRHLGSLPPRGERLKGRRALYRP
jgi:hypothetical protein